MRGNINIAAGALFVYSFLHLFFFLQLYWIYLLGNWYKQLYWYVFVMGAPPLCIWLSLNDVVWCDVMWLMLTCLFTTRPTYLHIYLLIYISINQPICQTVIPTDSIHLQCSIKTQQTQDINPTMDSSPPATPTKCQSLLILHHHLHHLFSIQQY